ncbi:MAG: hypothetical protein KAS32_25945 [Candidatus Peribacteraceae bacterium]|nr:hypothetical protein [Candidatus Peribacteraceae bacterium]
MSKINPVIEQAIIGERESWVALTIAQQNRIYDMFVNAENAILAKISRYSKGGKIPTYRLDALLTEIKKEMNALRPRIRGAVRQTQRKSIDEGMKSAMRGAIASGVSDNSSKIGTSFVDKEGNIQRHNPKKSSYSASAWAGINADAMEAMMRFEFGGTTFSRRVWDATYTSEKAIRDRVNLAVLTGESAEKVSRDIRKYLGVSDTIRGKELANFHPGAGVYKSAYKNSLRVASTELNRAFNEGMVRYAMKKKFIKGFIWRTGSGNPCPDCLDVEGNYYPKNEAPMLPLHPWCYCWLYTVYDEKL